MSFSGFHLGIQPMYDLSYHLHILGILHFMSYQVYQYNTLFVCINPMFILHFLQSHSGH